MAALHDLLAVQVTDIALSQASFRLAHLPERDEFATYDRVLREISARRDATATECSAADREIASLEARSAELDAQVTRLERQLKTVIAPREAEALQHEIAERRAERSACDERELELMESLDSHRVTLDNLAREIASATENRDAAARSLKAAKGLVEAEIGELTERRSAQCLVVPSSLLATYERKRAARPNGAVATLHGPTCGSCHMDLARTELDALYALPEGEYPECPQCGCFIVLIS